MGRRGGEGILTPSSLLLSRHQNKGREYTMEITHSFEITFQERERERATSASILWYSIGQQIGKQPAKHALVTEKKCDGRKCGINFDSRLQCGRTGTLFDVIYSVAVIPHPTVRRNSNIIIQLRPLCT